MAKSKKKAKPGSTTIAQNRKARHDFHIHDRIEAGVMFAGWEVKACRAGRAQLTDSYVVFEGGEPYLLNCQIQPLPEASTHFVTEPTRKRKLLLNHREISKLQEAADQKGYTIVALSLYWKKHLIKCEVGTAKGKQQHDKRQDDKDKDWARQKERMLKHDQ